MFETVNRLDVNHKHRDTCCSNANKHLRQQSAVSILLFKVCPYLDVTVHVAVQIVK